MSAHVRINSKPQYISDRKDIKFPNQNLFNRRKPDKKEDKHDRGHQGKPEQRRHEQERSSRSPRSDKKEAKYQKEGEFKDNKYSSDLDNLKTLCNTYNFKNCLNYKIKTSIFLPGDDNANYLYNIFKKINNPRLKYYIKFYMEFLNVVENGDSWLHLSKIKGTLLNLIQESKSKSKCTSSFDNILEKLVSTHKDFLDAGVANNIVNHFTYVPNDFEVKFKSSNDKKYTIKYKNMIELVAFELIHIKSVFDKNVKNLVSDLINAIKKTLIHMCIIKYNDLAITKLSLCLCLINELKQKFAQNPVQQIDYVNIDEMSKRAEPELLSDPTSKNKPQSKIFYDIPTNYPFLQSERQIKQEIDKINNIFKELHKNNILTTKGQHLIMGQYVNEIMVILNVHQNNNKLDEIQKHIILKGLENTHEKIKSYIENLSANLIFELNDQRVLNDYITKNEEKEIRKYIRDLLTKDPKPNNFKDVVTNVKSLFANSKIDRDETVKKIKQIMQMIQNPDLVVNVDDEVLNPDRIDLKKQIPGSRKDALRILNAGLEKNANIIYLKKQIALIVTNVTIKSIFFQENENELIIWINPYCNIDESKIEQTVLIPRRIYLWILSIVNTKTKILYHSVRIDKGKEIENFENINYMRTLCEMHDLIFYHVKIIDKFKIMDIVNCDKLITIQDLSEVLDDYLNVPTNFLERSFLKTVEISDNDNQFNIIFNKNQYNVIIPYNNELFENYKDFSVTAYHILMAKIGTRKIKIKYKSNLSSIKQIHDIYQKMFYKFF